MYLGRRQAQLLLLSLIITLFVLVQRRDFHLIPLSKEKKEIT